MTIHMYFARLASVCLLVVVTGGSAQTSSDEVRLVKTPTGYTEFHRPSFTKDGRLVVVSTYSSIEIIEANTGIVLQKLNDGDKFYRASALDPQGRYIVSVGSGGTKLWDLNNLRVRPRVLGSADLQTVVYSPDGRYVAAGNEDGSIYIWETSTWKLHGNLAFAKPLATLSISIDGKYLAASQGYESDGRWTQLSSTGRVGVWELGSLAQLWNRIIHKYDIPELIFSKDGVNIIAAAHSREKNESATLLLKTQTGDLISDFSKFPYRVLQLTYGGSDKSKILGIVAKENGTRSLISVSIPQAVIRSLCQDVPALERIAISNEGSAAVGMPRWGSSILLWPKFPTCDSIRMAGLNPGMNQNSTPFLKLGDALLMAAGKSILAWDMSKGGESYHLDLERPCERVGPGPTAETFAILFNDSISIRRAKDGVEIRKIDLSGVGRYIYNYAFIGQGKLAIAVGAAGNFFSIGEGEIFLFDEEKKEVAYRTAPHTKSVSQMAYDARTNTLFSGSLDGTIVRSETRTLAVLQRIEVGSQIHGLALHPNAPRFAAAFVQRADGGSIAEWQIGQDNPRWVTREAPMNSVEYSVNGQRLLVAGFDLIELDSVDGRRVRNFSTQVFEPFLVTASYADEGRLMVAELSGGEVFFWNLGVLSKSPFCELNVRMGGSVLICPEGFDVKSLEDLEQVGWVMPDEPLRSYALAVFMRDFFQPRILQRLLKGGDTPIRMNRSIRELNRVQPWITGPTVALDSASGQALVTVGTGWTRDGSQGNGKPETWPYDLRLFRNGQLVGQWPEPKSGIGGTNDIEAWRKESVVPMEPGQTKAEHTFRVALPSKDRGKPVVFTAYAFNEDRVKSETTKSEFVVPTDMPLRKPRAYVITVGVNSYELKDRDLSFAAKDARDLGAVLSRIKDHEVVKLTLVSEDSGPGVAATRQATKANVRGVLELLAGKSEAERARLKGVPDIDAKAVEQLRKATPDDVIVIAFSGHGYTDPDSGQFYLLPSDSGNEPAKVGKFGPEALSRFISSEELSQWLREVDAGQMAMIIDACHSASAVDKPGFKPGPMGDRGLGQLAYDKGMMILAATQASDVALEVQKIEQGLLTYALVADGFKQDKGKPARRNADIDRDGAISLREWLQYGERRVPGLYEDIRAGKVSAVHKDPRPDSNDTTARKAQTPSLFDFQRRAAEAVLER